jgi:hypothetical protein
MKVMLIGEKFGSSEGTTGVAILSIVGSSARFMKNTTLSNALSFQNPS